jgi:predicted dehydrogenase
LIRIGVIGFGYWGPNLTRNFFIPGHSHVVAICDANAEKCKIAAELYPAVQVFDNGLDLIRSDVDAIVIATPAQTHFDLAFAALKAGKHVLVSKPLTETSAQARALIGEAERRRLCLLVDHTFIYTGAVRHMHDFVQSGQLGRLFYYDAMRVNLGKFQPDVSVIWDLALHDLSIFDYVLGVQPSAVSVIGASHVAGSPENLAYMTLFLPDGAVAHINVSWLAPIKLRQTLIGGSKKMIVYDELEPSEKLRIFDKGVTFSHSAEEVLEGQIGYRLGGVHAPLLPSQEALGVEARHFVDCIETNVSPITGGAAALRLIEILECATLSMQQQGRPVEIAPGIRG